MQFRNQKFEKIKQQIEIYKEKKLLWEQDLQERKNSGAKLSIQKSSSSH